MIIDSIKNVTSWLPIVWKDRDFDYSYLLKLLKFKLLRMAETLENGYTVDRPKHAKRIKIVCVHIERYLNEPWLEVVESTEFIGKSCSEYPTGIKKNYFKNILFPHSQYKNADKLQQWHWEQIWRIISRYGRHWWD